MELFQLYNLTSTLRPDAAAVKRRYLELSRLHHPDRAAGASAGAQIEALQMTAAVNEGFRILSHPDRTLAYVLKEHGVLEDEEKYTLPPAFLMEMMDLNEAVDDGADAVTAVAPFLTDWDTSFVPLADRYELGERTDELLSALKDAYFRKKYLLRIAGRI